jgi:hypothetical protein
LIRDNGRGQPCAIEYCQRLFALTAALMNESRQGAFATTRFPNQYGRTGHGCHQADLLGEALLDRIVTVGKGGFPTLAYLFPQGEQSLRQWWYCYCRCGNGLGQDAPQYSQEFAFFA